MHVTAQRFSFAQTPEGVTLLDSGRKVYHYQSKTKSLNGLYPRANYIHPLYGFEEEVLTEDFPADHPHQRGIYWTWHQIFVSNFRAGDGWDCRNISWEVINTNTSVSQKKALLNTTCYWNSDSLNGIKSTPRRFLKEECSILYQSNNAAARELRFTITLTALTDTVKLGGSEDEKHYSGFSARLALPGDVQFISDTVKLVPELYGNIAGKTITMKGSFGSKKNTSFILQSGTADAAGKQKWILRKEKSMQNIAWPGSSSLLVLAPGKSLTVTYTLFIIQSDNTNNTK
ncbi:MAG: PmoA family protein [Lacibacter sp.]